MCKLPKQQNKETQSLFLYGLLSICFTSHTSHGVSICGLAGNIIKPQKQTAKKRLHVVLQHPLTRSVGEVAYTGRRWNTIKLILFLPEKTQLWNFLSWFLHYTSTILQYRNLYFFFENYCTIRLKVTRYLEERACNELFENKMLTKFVNGSRIDRGDMEVLVS